MLSVEPGQSAGRSIIVDSNASKEREVHPVEFTVQSGELTAGAGGVDNDVDAAERAVQDEESVFEKCDRGSLNHRPQD